MKKNIRLSSNEIILKTNLVTPINVIDTIDRIKLFSNKDNLNIYKEGSIYLFENRDQSLPYFITNDYLEAVSALMKLKNLINYDDLWNIEINKQMKESVSINKCLYWLTGGDREWIINKRYNQRWSEICDVFIDQYSDIINEVICDSNTLNDVRVHLIKDLNLPVLYEFSLDKGLI